ncbi:MAG: hypothetical protein IKK59_07495 [Lachnospiraceae bacterium]|nr:hypothetical protein [Lachnospiraceae bacterium]
MSKILIGWAEESIVPEKRVMLAGQFYERISEYVESDITVTAMAVEADGEQMIIASVDLVSVSEELLKLARQKFTAMMKEVAPEKIIVSAIHSHTSIGYQASGTSATQKILNEFLPEDRKYTSLVASVRDDVLTPDEAMEFLAEKIALAAKKAWESREEAFYANAFGRAVVGHCRRVVYDDGSAKMWGDTNSANFVEIEGGNDSGVELLYTFNKERKLTGVVANIACPAQVLEHRSFISSDYWGKVKQFLREKFGDDLYLLALCGAGGDQCPRDMIRWVNPETPINDPHVKREHYIERKADPSMFDIKGCTLIGKRVANEIIAVYEALDEPKDEAEFKHKVIKYDLPLRKVTPAEYEQAVREIEYYVQKNKDKEVFNYEDNAAMYVFAGTIARYRRQQTEETVPVEIHIAKLGNIAIATNPFELFLDYGNRIKARSKAEQTFLCQLTCGSMGYLPTVKAERGSHYSAYISSGHVGHEGGDMLVRKSVAEINDMWM